MALGMELGLGPGHIVLDGDPAPPQKGPKAHQFSAHVCCGQTAAWIKMPLSTEVGPAYATLCSMWTHLPSPNGAQTPQFSVNVRCGQTAGWTKMSLGMEIGLGPGDFVFDGDPVLPK